MTLTAIWMIAIVMVGGGPTLDLPPLPAQDSHLAKEASVPVPTYTPTVEPLTTGGTTVPHTVWIKVARCESGYGGEPNWSLNTGNGFYGGLQFALSSWQWVGGTGYPHHASTDEQIHRANLLWDRQGWGAWPTCSRKLGLR